MHNTLNTTKLSTMRDNYLQAYEAMNVHQHTAEHLVVLTTLNALLRVASNTHDLDEIETLTKAGRIMVEKYEHTYRK